MLRSSGAAQDKEGTENTEGKEHKAKEHKGRREKGGNPKS